MPILTISKLFMKAPYQRVLVASLGVRGPDKYPPNHLVGVYKRSKHAY